MGPGAASAFPSDTERVSDLEFYCLPAPFVIAIAISQYSRGM